VRPRRILYLQFTNPAAYPPLQRSALLLARRGWNVLLLGKRATETERLQFPAHDRLTLRQMRTSSSGWRLKFDYARFALWSILKTLLWRPRWVYASDALACPIALALGFIPRIRVIYHEHDAPAAAASTFMRFVLWARRSLAKRSILCVLPNQQRLETFLNEMGRNIRAICIMNCPLREELRADAPVRPHTTDAWLVYQGSIVPSRLPSSVIQALVCLPEQVKLRIIGYETCGAEGYVNQLQKLAADLGVAKRTEFLGALPFGEMLEQCAQSHIGLSLMPTASDDPNERAMVGASNKPFDYMTCGIPFLVTDLPEWREAYVEPGYAVAVDPNSPKSIAAAVGDLLRDAQRLRWIREQARQRIASDWNYEKEFEPVLWSIEQDG
jgi:glycosyltransferase involved in cell wall biosynthesis